MLTEPASILSREGNTLRLHTSRKASCSGCSMRSGCGQYLLLPQDDQLQVDACAQNALLQAGDQVQLELAEGRLLLLAALFYGLPLTGLLLGTLLAVLAAAGEGLTILAATVGILAGIGLSRWLLRQEAVRRRVAPQLRPLAVAGAAA